MTIATPTESITVVPTVDVPGTRPATQIPRDGAHGTNATRWRREIQRVWDDNQQVARASNCAARATVAVLGRLMRAMSLVGLSEAVRG